MNELLEKITVKELRAMLNIGQKQAQEIKKQCIEGKKRRFMIRADVYDYLGVNPRIIGNDPEMGLKFAS